MNKIKLWLLDKFFLKELKRPPKNLDASSKSKTSSSTGLIAGIVGRIGLRSGDTSSGDFEDNEYDLSVIATAYDTDSYIRQGVDKYVDQIFKEGWDLYGVDANAVEYLKLRLAYIAEATGVPTTQLLMDIAEDVVKYSNCIIAKARSNEADAIPSNLSIQGIDGKEPVAGYFCINATTMTAKRDKYGTVTQWKQTVDEEEVTFNAEDIIHIYYKREKGNCFGTPFLQPVLDDVRALRQAEENVLKMMYRNIYPFNHITVGDDETPGTKEEIEELQDTINTMDVEGGLITSNRVKINPIASNQVISAEPYLRYLEERVFSGMGIPAVLFGRGDTSNRSTSDSMASEMGDRIKAIQKTIEMFFNSFVIKELLIEGGYDPVTNQEHIVEFRFRDNDLDLKIKSETHAVYLYEHKAIDEDEMRKEIGRDAITDRAKMYNTLYGSSNNEGDESGNKETDNKQTPTNQYGTKTSPKKTTNELDGYKGLITDTIDELREKVINITNNYKLEEACIRIKTQFDLLKNNIKLLVEELHVPISDRYINDIEYQVNSIINNLDARDYKEKDRFIETILCYIDIVSSILINI